MAAPVAAPDDIAAPPAQALPITSVPVRSCFAHEPHF